jgi:hypothetical protein
MDAGAVVVTDATGEQDSVLAQEANRFGADLFLALRPGESQTHCAYFSTATFRSESGYCIARHLDAELRVVLGATGGVVGRTYPALRETRMAAVICELATADDPLLMPVVVAHGRDVAEAIVRGVRNGIEQPLEQPR